jgi:large subunit ribosomal protein L21
MNKNKKLSLIVEINGKQILIEKNKFYTIKNLNILNLKEIFINRILLMNINKKLFLGTPYIKSLKIKCQIFSQINTPKILTYKMKPKKGIRKKIGHSKKIINIYIKGIFIKKDLVFN